MTRLQLQRFQTDHNFIFGIACVKVRRLVIVPIHRNDDTEKLLSVGMGRVFFSQVWEQIFGLLAGDLKPEGIGAKIQLARPRQDAALLADGRIAEEFVISPWRENAFPYLSGKIHFAFGVF